MKQFFLFLHFTLLTIFCQAQTTDTIKVLFIGNSFTSVNDLPQTFAQLAQGANRPVVVASQMPGGVSVGDIAQGTMAHMNNPTVYNLIRSNNWNYVVLQDNQGRFVNTYGVFPSSSLVIKGHIQIRDSLLLHHPCAKMLWFAGWGPKTGYPGYANTGAGLINRIYNNYRYLLDTASQVIAPIGPAWERIMLVDSTINLWGPDQVHPDMPGTSITADVIYSSIFKTSATESNFVPLGVSSTVDQLLKTAAYQTVMDSLNFTGLNTITPKITQTGNTLNITGYSTCKWYLNNVYITSNSGVLGITSTGKYSAIVFDQNNCQYRTQDLNVSSASGLISLNATSQHLQVFPNPSKGQFTLTHADEEAEITVIDVMGRLVFATQTKESVLTFEISTTGIYYAQLITAQGSWVQKVIVAN